MMKKTKKILFLRKKVEGENSMEELAYSLANEIKDLEILTLPGYSTKFLGMIKNIVFAIKHQGDINHVFSINDAYIIPFLKGKKILTCHDLGTLNSFRLYGKITAWLCWVYIPSFFWNTCTCISSEVKKELDNVIPWRKKSIKIVYNFYNKKIKFQKKESKNKTPIILHIGTARRKNLKNVIYALDKINCKIIIVGKMFPEQELAIKECHTNYENYIDLTFDEIIKLYQESDIVSFPSSYEGFGVPLIEGNAAGRAVIAGNIPVLKEIGKDAAIYVNPQNIEELKNAFTSLINNIELRDFLIDKGLKNAKRFTIKEIAKQYNDLYTL